MENPNVNVNLRRHNSLPAHRSSSSRGSRRFSSHRSRLAAKSNPYVGWFRHSPPISSFSGASRTQECRQWQCRESSGECHASHLQCQRDSLAQCHLSSTYALHQQSCPYVGWFRHAPSSCNSNSGRRRDMLSEYLETELSLLLRAIPTPDCHGLLRLSDLLCSGQLAGGAPAGDWKPTNRSHQSGPSPETAYASLTEHVLRRMTCWLLTPFLQTQELKMPSKMCQLEDEDVSVSGDEGSLSSGDPLDEDCSCCSSSVEEASVEHRHVSEGANTTSSSQRRSSSSSSSSMMVSSQAEAYYAHHAVSSSPGSSYSTLRNCNVYESTNSIDDGSSGGGFLGRLDYNITQMDIVRMTRNASRHLDVESILKLPTVTYQEDERSTSKKKNTMAKIKEDEEHTDSVIISTPTRYPEEEGSWLIVHQDTATNSFLDSDSAAMSDIGEEQRQDKEKERGCVICLEPFQPGDRLRVLPCNHSFHIGCIDRWLSGSHSFEECYTAGCPTCKKHPCKDDQDELMLSTCSDGSVPSWAFSRIGNALAREALRE